MRNQIDEDSHKDIDQIVKIISGISILNKFIHVNQIKAAFFRIFSPWNSVSPDYTLTYKSYQNFLEF